MLGSQRCRNSAAEVIRFLTSADNPCRASMLWMGEMEGQGTPGSGNSTCKKKNPWEGLGCACPERGPPGEKVWWGHFDKNVA